MQVSVRVIDIRAVGHLVQNGLRVGPKPGERPEQSAETKRQQAKALDSSKLWMPSLFGNLFREDMDQQEDHDQDGRDDDERKPRDDVRDGIERLAMEHGGVRDSWPRPQRQHDEPAY